MSESETVPLAPVAAGCARLGEATAGVSWRASVRMVRDLFAGGVRHFDTADTYTSGTSERLLGLALGRAREQAWLATKAGYIFRERSEVEARLRFLAGPVVQRLGRSAIASTTGGQSYSEQNFDPTYLRSALKASLSRLRTDYCDLFQLHAPRGVDVESALAMAQDMRSEGLIREFGIGVETLDQIDPWLDKAGLDRIQMSFGIADASDSMPMVAAARERGVKVIARSVLARGSIVSSAAPQAALSLGARLAKLAKECGRTPLSLAIDFARASGGISLVVVGVRLPHHVPELVAAAQRARMDANLLKHLQEIAVAK